MTTTKSHPSAVFRVLLCLGLGWGAMAHGANVLQTFHVPLPEGDMQISLNAIDAYRGYIGDEMQSAISIVVGTDGTVVYYDHWEDGYEDDLTSPTQTTSQVWGDADPGNGSPPGFPGDVLDAGDVVLLESTIDVTRNSVTIEYDGRDKVMVNFPVAMTRGMYAVDPGEVLAEAIGVFDAGTHGTRYRTPVGVNTGTGFGTNSMFSYTAFYLMAEHDFTRIDIDKDNDGVFEETVYLDEGEPYFVNGNVLQGATVQGSQPFQCHLVTGDVGSTYEMRWFELWPESQWGTDYFTPVGSRSYGGNDYPALVYLFNPNAETVTVTYVTATNTGTLSIPPDDVYDVFQMPVDGAARFYTTNGMPFIGVDVFDTSVGGGTLYGYPQHCQTYDWGIGLMPVNMMSTMGVVGWGPGYGTTAPGTNGNPVWVAAAAATTVYVDYDSDPDTGPLVDPQGNRYDFATNVTALESVRLADMTDEDQTGMRFYTVDGTVLLGAWGEDPAWAQPGNPYLDMGYAIPAFPTIISKKFASLLNDVNGNGYADAGDTIEYFVDVVNVGFATANNVIFEDVLPTNLTAYVTNSAMQAGGGSTNAIPDSLPPKLTRFPFDEGGWNLGTIALGATSTVRYVTQVLTNLPPGFSGYIHNNASVGGTNGNWTGGWTIPARVGGLAIAKATSTTNLLEPGTNFTYTVTLANTGTVTFTGIQIEDELPLGVTYVPGSAQIQLTGGITNTVADRFNVRTVTNSNGNIPWLSGWQEFGESDGVAAGGVQVRSDVATNVPLEAYALMVGDAGRGAGRQADLSGHTNAVLSFTFRRDGLDGGTDYVDVWISSNNWATSNQLVQLAGAADETNRTPTNINVSAWISTNTGIRFLSSGTMGGSDFVWFDDVTFTLVGSDATFAGTAPPLLAQNLTLPPGGSVTATLGVTVDLPPLATQVVNSARTRADQDSAWLDSNPVTNAINATEGVTLLKTTGTTNYLTAGTSVVYTIEIANTGTVAQTGIHLEDTLPYGMTFVSAELYRPFLHTNEFLDRFDRQAYTNSDGNVAWTGPWTETGDDGSPTGGDIDIAVDGTSIPGQTYALRTAGTAGIQRGADLAGYTNVTLWLDYRSVGLEAGEYVAVQLSSNGGGGFTEIAQIGTDTDDGSYFPTNYNISAYASTGTVVRFEGGGGRSGADYVWLDNIRLSASASDATNTLPPPPDLLDGYTLPPLTNMTVTVTAQVNDPLEALEFVNTATMTSDQQTTPLVSSVTNQGAGTAGMTVAKTSSIAANWNLGATNTYTITVENTGTVALTELTVRDVLPPGAAYVPGSTVVRIAGDVVETVTTTNTVRDEFNAIAFTNQDGTLEWSNDWQELNESNGADANAVRVEDNWGAPYQMRVYNSSRGAWREVNLDGMASAVLSFDYRIVGYDGGETSYLSVSTNGGTSWVDLETWTANLGTTTSTNLDLTSYMSASTAIAFTNAAVNGGGEGPQLDDITITFTSNSIVTNWVVTTNAGAAPPNVVTGAVLNPGQTMTIDLGAVLEVPLPGTQFVNTATATNRQTPPASASVTNVSVLNDVGDFVWFDADGDGIQDGGETGLTGVVVRLYDTQTNLLLTTTSGVAGAYAFTNLPTGDYFLTFTASSNYTPTAQNQGGNDALDSDISTNTGQTAVFTLSGGTNDLTRDAGFYQPASSIGDFVWNDLDGDGVQDGGSETGMPGVVVTLYDAASNAVGVTTTSVAGAYSFTNLPTGSYFLEFSPPADYTYTLPNQGGNDNLDSDVSPVTGQTALFFLPPGTADTSRDAGLAAIVYGLTLSKTSDAVTCLSGGDTITYTLTIENTGTTSQTGIVLEDVLPAGLTYVPDSSTVAAWGSVSNTWRDEFSSISYANQDGTQNWAVDWQEDDPAGTAGPNGDYVGVTAAGLTFHYLYVGDEAAWRWADLSGETNATLSLDWETDGLDANEFLDVRIATSPNGTFTQLAQLGGTASGTTNFDITAYISTGTTVRFEATPGTENWESGEYAYIDNLQIETVRAGIATNPAGAPPALVTNLTLGTGETATVVFQATLDSPPTVTQLLNTASAYSAVQPAVPASVTNCVESADVGVAKFVTETAPDQAEIIDYRVVATNNGPDTATGMQLTDLLPNQVQYNSHSNGVYNPTTGVWNIGTLAVGASTTLYFNVTVYEGTGGMRITNTATITARDLYDPNPSNDTSSVVIVPTGGAAVGDRVWFDTNRDGIQDPGETNGIANVPVALMSTNGTVVTTTVTSASGLYQFTDILPGTYYVRFDLAPVTTNVTLSPAGAGGDGAQDSDVPNGGTGGYAWTTNFTLAGGQTNLDLDLGLRLASATRADVAEVWGEGRNGAGVIGWRTISEWNTAGFHVYRVDPETGAETRINDVLVPAVMQDTGGLYSLVDPEARAGNAAVYRLEETELTGAVLDLGTHVVTFGPPPAAGKTARAKSRAPARKTAKPVAQPKLRRSGTSGLLKVTWRNEGLYAVDVADIATGMGLETAQVAALAATNGLAFTCGNLPVRTIYDEARGRLVFHGQATDNWYTRDNAVLISAGAGQTMPRRSPGLSRGTAVFPVTVRFEQERYPFDSAAVLPEDFYCWDYVISATSETAVSVRHFPLDLSGADGDVGLVVRLQGWSITTNNPDHLAELYLNGHFLGPVTFDGQEIVEAEALAPAAWVLDGTNTLTVKGVLQAGRTHSYFVVDRVDASFDRWISPVDGTAHFHPGEAAAAWVPAFENPLVVALDGAGQATWISADGEGRLPGKAWAVAPGDARYALIETENVPVLEPEPADDDPWFLAGTNRIDYLIVVSRELEPAVQPLADYRAGQGLRTGVAVFEDVCDWLAAGLRTPEAVPALLAYAQATWTEAPWLVVLAGNGHYDFLGALSNEVNQIPPLMLQTQDGIFAADGLMTDIDEDGLPDAAVGRLPAITTNDLAEMIAKIQAYEADFGAAWEQSLVLANDTADAGAGDFAAANDALAALAEPEFPVERIDLDTTATNEAVPALLARFDNGAGLIHYTGHGGPANWSSKGLLKKAHVEVMTNAPKPVVAALSCLVGRFEAPGSSSLGELLLRQAGGGAAAAWGPSGLSRNAPAAGLGEAFYREVFQDGSGTLGLAILRAVRSGERDLTTRDTLAVYNLLGDPALRIAGNTGGHPADETFAQWRWQRFSPQDLADPEISGADAVFAGYALDTNTPVRVETPEFGFDPPADAGNGFILRWKRRVRRSDINYRLFLSEDLQAWEADSPDLDEVGAESDPDGVMETVRTRVERPGIRRVFLGIKAERK